MGEVRAQVAGGVLQALPGVLRVRGMEWDPGYSAEVPAEEMRPVSSILTGA